MVEGVSVNARDFCILVCLIAVRSAAGQATPSRIEAVDRATGRGVPLVDADSERKIQHRPGSVRWNGYRKRWIAIFGEAYGESSLLGEMWYAEAAEVTGPWPRAKKIVTHDRYSFYTVTQHDFMDGAGGRYVYFEGTYIKMFSQTRVKTPRYDYNQIMYRLDLDDPRLKMQ